MIKSIFRFYFKVDCINSTVNNLYPGILCLSGKEETRGLCAGMVQVNAVNAKSHIFEFLSIFLESLFMRDARYSGTNM